MIAVAVLAVLAIPCMVLYLLPLLIGIARRAPDLPAVAVVNIALGCTVIGWFAALAMALRNPAPAAVVQVIQGPPAVWWQGPPGLAPGPGWEPPPPALPPQPPRPWAPPPGPPPE